jgi:hypothetical protein
MRPLSYKYSSFWLGFLDQMEFFLTKGRRIFQALLVYGEEELDSFPSFY